jgi:uncharacterized protein
MNDLAASPKKATIVTGASEGIGAELARIFAGNGHEVVLVARRRDRLETLAAEIQAKGGKAHVVELDLCGEGAVDALEKILEQNGLTPEILVNNAGFGLIGPAATLEEAHQLEMVELNIKALSALTLRFMKPIMAAKGGILNVASIASFMPGPNFAVYYATKAYVRSFSEAIAQELAPLGVKVSCLCPGPVVTGFQARAGFDFTGAMSAMKPSLVSAEDVARQGYEGLFAGKRVVIPGLMNKFTVAFARLTPRAILMPILAFAQNGRT